MSPAYFTVLGVLVVAMIVGLDFYRRRLRVGEDASLRQTLQGNLFPCVLIKGAGAGFVDVAMGGVVGGSGLAAITFGAFRAARAYFKDDEFIVDTIDPHNVSQRMEVLGVRRDRMRKMVLRPYHVGGQLRRLGQVAAIVGVSLGGLITLAILTKVGFDHPRAWLVVVVGVGFGLVMGLVFGVVPSLFGLRRGRWLLEIYGDSDLLHGRIAIEQELKDKVASILTSLGILLEHQAGSAKPPEAAS